MSGRVVLFLLASVAAVAQAQNSTCCEALRGSGLEYVYFRDTPAYQERNISYFSVSAQLDPICFVQPTGTADVVKTVNILVKHPACLDTKFAVRSGGHMQWAGSNNIDDGVTVDLGLMNSTTLESNGIAAVQPGARWGAVYEALDPFNYTVVGGREHAVGVAGFLTGGGNSFFSARFGFAADTVKNFEVVLANGEVVNANLNENSDLFQVLKGGGGSNYGIVTRFDMYAVAITKLWGGVGIWDTSYREQHINAHIKWVDNVEKYPPGSTVMAFTYQPVLGGSVILNFHHDTEGHVAAPAFDDFLAIPQVSNTFRIASHTEMADELELPYGYRNVWFTTAVRNDPRIYNKIVDLHNQLTEEWKSEGDPDFMAETNFQAIPRSFTEHSLANGGNILGLDQVNENVVMNLFVIAVRTRDLEVKATEKIKAYGAQIEAFAASVDGLVDWRYLNYAGGGYQDPLASYGEESSAKMKAASAKYDPTGIFQTKSPAGFKLSNSRAGS
ncbi:unnamed protein product [Periconia digitata]|uniref:FAD-binding PCMH-type domain-containing protein n=1 Tax=Periconia digitata TaxID=1303443 RepID=A0A9W4UT84_9PLEO|nr:unnamed protein product [Periconia digitata]